LAVLHLREQYPRWGKDKLVVLLHRAGWTVSTSMVGRILTSLKARGVLVEPVRSGISTSKRLWRRPYAIRKPKGYAASSTLHRVTSNWSEGAVVPTTSGGGSGAPPEEDSATWVHRSFPDVAWETPGGDFDDAPSATFTVPLLPRLQTLAATWGSTGEMVSDVQGWLDDPASNHGWIVLGTEGTNQTAKRAVSRENETAENRPRLLIEFFPRAG
jgi:hypothetical protein